MLKNGLKIAGCEVLHEGNHNVLENPHQQYELINKTIINATYSSTKYVKLGNISGESNNFAINDTFVLRIAQNITGHKGEYIINIYNNYKDKKSITVTGTQNNNFVFTVGINTFNYQEIDIDIYARLSPYNTIKCECNYYSADSETDKLKFTLRNDSYDSLPSLNITGISRAIHSEIFYNAAIGWDTWEVDDKIINNSPALGSYAGWVCTVAGTPGTWVGYGQIGVIKGTTSQRPSSGIYAGYQYLDTTLNANGKLITYNGTNWVDSTGTIV